MEIVEGPQAGRRIPLTGPIELGHGPAHLSVDGQLLVGVTLLQLRPATAEGGQSAASSSWPRSR